MYLAFLDAGQIALCIPIIALCIPITAILAKHRERIEEIKARAVVNVDNELRAELDEMKRQIVSLRDTTTKFDMAFDSQLEGIEKRIERVETRSYQTGEDAARVTLGR